MNDAVKAAKRRLRREMRARRGEVPARAAAEAAREVARCVAATPEFGAAARVALYAALPDELPSRPCFDAVLGAGKTALLPCVEGERLVFRKLERWEHLRPGRFGISEPPEGGPERAPGTGDLVLVPGVAFDARGHRLGRGGGYYDAAFPPGSGGPVLFGVGYAFQVLESVPHGSRDRGMDAIVTERGVHRASGVGA